MFLKKSHKGSDYANSQHHGKAEFMLSTLMIPVSLNTGVDSED